MMYCPNCYILLNADRCPNCGTRHLRQPYADDFCYLTEMEGIWTDTFQDVLEQNGIPCFIRPANGTWAIPSLGVTYVRSKIHVPFARLDEARELAQELFSEDPIAE